MLLSLVMVACEKKATDNTVINPPKQPSDSTKTLPFLYVPRRDVKWVVHYQGSVMNDPVSRWDSAFHFYATITASGQDTLAAGHSYTKYHAQIEHYYRDTLKSEYYRSIFLREDTAAQNVVFFGIYDQTLQGILDFIPKDTVNVQHFWLWPKGSIVKADSVTIDGVRYPRWNYKTATQEFFYQAAGIGGVAGPLGAPYSNLLISGGGGIPRSLDFVYKNDSLHFDFPPYR